MSIPQSGGGLVESRDQLAAYLESGSKPVEDWRIGTEHEKFGYRKDDLLPLPYEGDCSIHAMLSGIGERFGWEPVEEAGNLIGLTRDGANVSLEPGGQLELSGAPVETVHQTSDELARAPARSGEPCRRDGRRLHRPGRRADLAPGPDAGDAQGPLCADDPPHEGGRQPRHADDVPHLHGAGEPRLRVRSRHGEEVPGVAGAPADRHGALRQLAFPRRQAERLAVVARADSGATPIRHGRACCRSSSRTA